MKTLNHPFYHLIKGTEAVLPLTWPFLDHFCFPVLQLFFSFYAGRHLHLLLSTSPFALYLTKKARFSYKIGMYFSLPVSAMDSFILIRIEAHILPELVWRDQVGLSHAFSLKLQS